MIESQVRDADLLVAVARLRRDNTVATNAASTTSRSSSRADQMCVSTALGRIGQVARKVEGLVVRLDRGSSNLPGRIFALFAGLSRRRADRSRRGQGFAMPRKEAVVKARSASYSGESRAKAPSPRFAGLFGLGTSVGTLRAHAPARCLEALDARARRGVDERAAAVLEHELDFLVHAHEGPTEADRQEPVPFFVADSGGRPARSCQSGRSWRHHYRDRLAVGHHAVSIRDAVQATVRSNTRPGSIRPSITSGSTSSR
jgi:hypothetical protein